MTIATFPEILELLLLERGLSPEDRINFLNPDYAKLHDPILLSDMEAARERVLKAVGANERIAVFSDYDADGIPGAVVLSDFFKRIGYGNVRFYIPHRHDEGFGLNAEAVEELAKEGARLLITVDCGISDTAEVALANSLGLDVIITDHHEAGEKLPEALAIVNPRHPLSTYPFPHLCGAAVAYKLVQAMLEKNDFSLKPGIEKWSLDMVGIATLSDMVPLVGENRILASFGLNVLRKSRRPGLLALFDNLRLDQRYLTEDDVGFMITPRINAASRMGTPEDAFRLLITDSEEEGRILAEHLERINQERKGLVASMVKEAKKHLGVREDIPGVIVIGNPEWRPSLAGLVANTLAEEYERPVFVWARDGDGVIKGSCRSYNGYDLFELMCKASGSFIEFGGHKGAGGFSVTLEQLTQLEEKLSEALKAVGQLLSCPTAKSMLINLNDISENLWQTVSQFAPFGIGNEKPVFKIKNAPIKSLKQFGKENNHLELSLGNGTKAISFFSDLSTYSLSSSQQACTLYGTLEKSYFRNRPELRLRIVDIEA